jgi:hypothetical protein
VTAPPTLPRRDAYTPPVWWQPYAAEFPRWRAWQDASQLCARLPGTMRVCHADDVEGLANQIRIADANIANTRQGQAIRTPVSNDGR